MSNDETAKHQNGVIHYAKPEVHRDSNPVRDRFRKTERKNEKIDYIPVTRPTLRLSNSSIIIINLPFKSMLRNWAAKWLKTLLPNVV